MQVVSNVTPLLRPCGAKKPPLVVKSNEHPWIAAVSDEDRAHVDPARSGRPIERFFNNIVRRNQGLGPIGLGRDELPQGVWLPLAIEALHATWDLASWWTELAPRGRAHPNRRKALYCTARYLDGSRSEAGILCNGAARCVLVLPADTGEFEPVGEDADGVIVDIDYTRTRAVPDAYRQAYDRTRNGPQQQDELDADLIEREDWPNPLRRPSFRHE
jgi:hypothetical protein